VTRSLYVPLGNDWANFEAGLSKSSRQNLARKSKFAREMGAVTYEAATPAPTELPAQIDDFVRVEASGWKGRDGTALAINRHQQAAIRAYLDACAKERTARIMTMRIGGEIAAMKLAVIHDGRLWEIKIAYDEKYARCSPGILLTHETLRRASSENLSAYEFAGEEEAWERLWTGSSHTHQDFRLYPMAPAGLAALARDASRTALQRGYAKFKNFRTAKPQSG